MRVASEPDGTQTAVGVRIAPPHRTAVLEVAAPSYPPIVVAFIVVLSTAAAVALVFMGMPLLQTPIAFVAAMVTLSMVVRLVILVGQIARDIVQWQFKRRWITAWHRKF